MTTLAERMDAVDRAGIPAFRSSTALQPARQLILGVRRLGVRKGIQPMDESNLHAQVSAWLNSGLTVPEAERRLGESGVAPEDASSVVNAVLAQQVSDIAARERRRARAPFLGGIALCILGVLLMVAGIVAFVSPESGLPAHVGVFAGGAAGLGGGITLIVRAVS
jgi:hypothetical protein